MLTIRTKATDGKPSVILSQSPALAPIKKAHAVQSVRYQLHVCTALHDIQRARTDGYRNAQGFAQYLNDNKIVASNGGLWNQASVLRAMKCLKRLGLDKGSLPNGQARRTWYIGSHSQGPAITH